MSDVRAGQILSYLKDCRDEQLEMLKALVSAESPSLEPALLVPVFDLLQSALEEIDYRVTRISGRESGGLLYASPVHRIKGSPCQLLLGHADTVWPAGTTLNRPPRVEGNTFSGPGVFDMKVGLVQMVFALKCLRDLRIAPTVSPLILVTSDEELGSEDSIKLIQSLAKRVQRVLVPEPSTGTEGRLKTSRKGVGVFRIRICGKAAHAGLEPESGISAVVELSHVIQKLERLNDPQDGLHVTVGIVSGGTRVNMVPAESLAEVDVRFTTTEQGKRIEKAIRGLKPTLPGAKISIEGGLERLPMEKTPANRALWELAREKGRELGLELEESHSGGGSDGNFTSPWTATLDGLGGVGGGAHAEHEFIYIDKMVERTALLALLIASD